MFGLPSVHEAFTFCGAENLAGQANSAGAVKGTAEHPFDPLARARCRVIVNTGNRPMSDTAMGLEMC
ncbi:hypothetical protein AWC11_17490 [Mycobacterium interjectum]|nr:hypothetical protein AWC11_17490 [Mycobacterium interjectum]